MKSRCFFEIGNDWERTAKVGKSSEDNFAWYSTPTEVVTSLFVFCFNSFEKCTLGSSRSAMLAVNRFSVQIDLSSVCINKTENFLSGCYSQEVTHGQRHAAGWGHPPAQWSWRGSVSEDLLLHI